MKPLKSLLTLILIANYAIAQKPDKALINVKYTLSHMRDTTDRENFYKETMLLVAGKDASVFLSYDGILKDIASKKSFEQQIKDQNGNITSIIMPKSTRPIIQNQYYYFAGEDKFFTHERMGVIYETVQPVDKIDWKISKETLNIEGIKCTKATTNYKGRNWTVWFAEELPFVSGPWKLVGLPGLILQAHDDKKEVMFDFAGLEKVAENKPKKVVDPNDKLAIGNIGSSGILDDNEITLPTKNVVKTTIAELDRLRKARTADPQGFAKAQLANMGMGVSPTITLASPNVIKKVIFNNPIDKTQL